MYRILLADSEGVAVDSLKYIITRRFGDACDIRIASNSRQVFDIFRKYAPDIVFLNIHMSGIHGIYTIRELHAIHRNSIFLVVSYGKKINYHREGDYMRVVDYLKKPIRRAAAIDALTKAFAKIDHDRSLVLRKRENKEKLETVIPIIESGFISRLLLPDQDTGDLPSYQKLLDIPMGSCWVMALSFCESLENGIMQNPVGATVQLQKQITLFRVIIKAFFPKAVVGPILANQIIVYVPCSPEDDSPQAGDFRRSRTEKMKTQLHRKLNLHFEIGIGSVVDITAASHSLLEAKKQLSYPR